MKKILLVLLLIVSCSSLMAQKEDSTFTIPAPVPISIDSVNNYIGKTVRIKSKVYGVKETGKVAFINVGASFPNAPLTLFISYDALKNFKDVSIPSYDGKEIPVYGKLELYRNKPQIAIMFPNQIVVKEQ